MGDFNQNDDLAGAARRVEESARLTTAAIQKKLELDAAKLRAATLRTEIKVRKSNIDTIETPRSREWRQSEDRRSSQPTRSATKRVGHARC
jgi:hypothetical protein